MNTLAQSRAGLESFESDLRETLIERATRRRERLAFSDDLAEDLLAIRLLDDLAADAERLSPQVYLLHRSIFAHAWLARVYRRERLHILDRIGVDYHPNGINDLVGWMVRQVCDMAEQDGRTTGLHAGPSWLDRRPAARRFLVEISAGFGIMAPVLGVLQGRTAYRQWGETTYASDHVAVPATLERTDIVDQGGKTERHTAVISFVAKPGSEPCRVTITAEADHPLPPPGHAMSVVPRDGTCVAPLVPSQIGSPGLSLALSLSMIALGLSCLRLCSLLSRRGRGLGISTRSSARRLGIAHVS